MSSLTNNRVESFKNSNPNTRQKKQRLEVLSSLPNAYLDVDLSQDQSRDAVDSSEISRKYSPDAINDRLSKSVPACYHKIRLSNLSNRTLKGNAVILV